MVTTLEDSNRIMQENGGMVIKNCIISSACVSPYMGSELKDSNGNVFDGIDPNKIYGVLRPKEEIIKVKGSFENVPLLNEHTYTSDIAPDMVGKTLGTISDVEMRGDDLYATVHVWYKFGVDLIKGGKADLSCGYSYRLVEEEGEFNGTPYHFKMVDLEGDHVALVDSGRVDKAKVADSNNTLTKEIMRMSNKLMGLLKSFTGDSDYTKEEDMDYEANNVKNEIKSVEESSMPKDEKRTKLNKLYELHKKLEEARNGDAKDEDIKLMEDALIKAEDEAMGAPALEDKQTEIDKDDERTGEMKKAIASDSAHILAEKMYMAFAGTKDLCDRAMGQPMNFAFDSGIESMVDQTMVAKGQDPKGMSLDSKIAVLNYMASQPKVQESKKNIFEDSAINYDAIESLKNTEFARFVK